jgi:hypothetical protein
VAKPTAERRAPSRAPYSLFPHHRSPWQAPSFQPDNPKTIITDHALPPCHTAFPRILTHFPAFSAFPPHSKVCLVNLAGAPGKPRQEDVVLPITAPHLIFLYPGCTILFFSLTSINITMSEFRTRARLVCTRCHERKVRCNLSDQPDGTACRNCQRDQFQCRFSISSALVLMMRP